MKRIVVEFTYDVDIIEVPEDIEKNIKKIQLRFDKWIHDKSINHSYWEYRNGKKYCPNFRAKAFVEYINSNEIIEKKS